MVCQSLPIPPADDRVDAIFWPSLSLQGPRYESAQSHQLTDETSPAPGAILVIQEPLHATLPTTIMLASLVVQITNQRCTVRHDRILLRKLGVLCCSRT